MEREWLDTLASINTDEVTFIDYVEAGNKLSQQLKQEVGPTLVARKKCVSVEQVKSKLWNEVENLDSMCCTLII